MTETPRPTDGTTSFGPFEIRHRTLGTGPPILLLHGVYAGATSAEWRAPVPELAVGHAVIVPDLLGAGRSDRPDLDWTAGTLSAVVDTVIRANPRALVVGS